jgi:hypothetical protein
LVFAVAVVLAFLSVIPSGNLLFALRLYTHISLPTPHTLRHPTHITPK